ncbi:MAG: hypothetical protein ABMA25_04595 [Ilumatobacteraceae bacterium]
MSTHRLSQYPDLMSVLGALPADERAPRVQRVVEHAAAANGVIDECRTADDLADLTAQYDDAAWTIQEQIDTDGGSDEEYLAMFRKARAVNAWMNAFGDPTFDDCCDATYEAFFALDNDEARVVALLTADLSTAPWNDR